MALADQGRQLRSYSLTSGASVSLDNVVIHTDHLNRVPRARRAASGPPVGCSRWRTPSRHSPPSGQCSWVVTDPHDFSSRGRGVRQPGTGMLMSLVVRARAGNGTAELSRIAGDLGLTVAWQANKRPGGLRAFRCPRRVAGSTIAHYAVATKQDRTVSSDRCNTRVVRELRWFMVGRVRRRRRRSGSCSSG